MKLLKAVIATTLISSAHASPIITPPAVPKKLHVYDSAGNTYVQLASTDCSSVTYYIPQDHEKYDTIISILLAAQLAERQVEGRFDGCNGSGQGKLIGVYLR